MVFRVGTLWEGVKQMDIEGRLEDVWVTVKALKQMVDRDRKYQVVIDILFLLALILLYLRG